MQIPLERKKLTVQEAADMLNVRRERIWKLMNDGVLSAEQSKLDGRQKLIPREQVDALLLEEGFRPRRMAHRAKKDIPEPKPESVGITTTPVLEERDSVAGYSSTPWPRSIGMVSDGTLPSSESEEYLRHVLHGTV